MTHKEFARLVETYGSDWRRWPEYLRAEAQALLATSAAARSAQNVERKLDELLDHLQPEPAGDFFEGLLLERTKTLAQAEIHNLPTVTRRWSRTNLARAAVFTGLFLLGLTLGANESSWHPASIIDTNVRSLLSESLFAEEWIP